MNLIQQLRQPVLSLLGLIRQAWSQEMLLKDYQASYIQITEETVYG